MKKFIEKHSEEIVGTLTCPDRMIFKGYLPFYDGRSMERFLYSKGLLFKELSSFLQKQSAILKKHAEQMAEEIGQSVEYLNGGNLRKDEKALEIALEKNITEGLVCIFSRVEAARTFKLKYGKKRPCIERHFGKCLCLYFYFMDKEFGLIHVRLQTWFSLDIQVYVNGHTWLAQQMDKKGISYEKSDNTFVQIGNWQKAQKVADQFVKKNMVNFLEKYAKKINPLLKTLLQPMNYYWVTAQAEFSTDILFKKANSFKALYEKMVSHSIVATSCTDVLKFLEKKLHGNFQGEVNTSSKKLKIKRIEGIRIKHEVKKNRIKMYTKSGLVLRIETVINNPYDFKVGFKKDGQVHYKKMKKSVTNLYKYQEVAVRANWKYLETLSQVDNPKDGLEALNELTKRKIKKKKSIKPFSPLSELDSSAFAAISRGEFTINGFRNADIKECLTGKGWFQASQLKKQKTGIISRLLGRLRDYGLIKKIPRSRRWQLTKRGAQITSTCLRIKKIYFPNEFIHSSAA
jgi:hypothetical protein